MQANNVKKAYSCFACGGTFGCTCERERIRRASMFKNKLRLLGMSALVGAGLLASGPASAYEMRLGDVDIEVSTIGSVGLSVRTANRNKRFLPGGNGGYLDQRVV